MAKYNVTHTCGHAMEYNISGRVADRESKAKWYESRACLLCQRASEAKEASAQAQVQGLPALVGTEKQVAWAMALRMRAGKRMEDMYRGQAMTAEASAVVKRATDMLLAEPRAKWWIENHDRILSILQNQMRALVAETLEAEKENV